MTNTMPNTEDTKLIIALLNASKATSDEQNSKLNEDMEHMHECVHSIDENVKGIRAYFIGIDPKQHIIHHVKMEENEELSKDIRKAVWGAVISAVFTGIMAFTSWTNIKVQDEIRTKLAEVVKAQEVQEAQSNSRDQRK